jgi:hypothetical protein
VKWNVRRGCRVSKTRTLDAVGGIVVEDRAHQVAGRYGSFRKRMDSWWRCRALHWPITVPSRTLSATNMLLGQCGRELLRHAHPPAIAARCLPLAGRPAGRRSTATSGSTTANPSLLCGLPIPTASSRRSIAGMVSGVGVKPTNLQGQRRQYELVGVARRRGFRDIEVSDGNMGRSASGRLHGRSSIGSRVEKGGFLAHCSH